MGGVKNYHGDDSQDFVILLAIPTAPREHALRA